MGSIPQSLNTHSERIRLEVSSLSGRRILAPLGRGSSIRAFAEAIQVNGKVVKYPPFPKGGMGVGVPIFPL